MATERAPSDQLSSLRAETRQGDGVNPRDETDSNQGRKRSPRKARQLCRQVADTLNMVLSGECNDDVLRCLYVASVEPAPDSSRLLVSVASQFPGQMLSSCDVLERLARASGKLRSEVAAAIHRKRTPELVYRLVEPDSGC